MSRVVFTSQDVKNIMRNIFNGNLLEHNLSNGEIAYNNPNSETIFLLEEDGSRTEEDLAKYLNITFYAWKNRIIEKADQYSNVLFDSWIESLNDSMNDSFALVELIDDESVVSQDIDSSTITGRITFLVQSDKISNLDYYVSKIRNNYLGNPQNISDFYGNQIMSYFNIGRLIYEEEPITIQIGECIQASCNFNMTYVKNARTYDDISIGFSFSFNEKTEASDFSYFPITKFNYQSIYTTIATTVAERPDLTGFCATALSCAKTFTFFDYGQNDFIKNLMIIAFSKSSYMQGEATTANPALSKTTVSDVNVPIYVKITLKPYGSTGNTIDEKFRSYLYKDMIDSIQISFTNNDFTIISMNLKGWGKIQSITSNVTGEE